VALTRLPCTHSQRRRLATAQRAARKQCEAEFRGSDDLFEAQ